MLVLRFSQLKIDEIYQLADFGFRQLGIDETYHEEVCERFVSCELTRSAPSSLGS